MQIQQQTPCTGIKVAPRLAPVTKQAHSPEEKSLTATDCLCIGTFFAVAAMPVLGTFTNTFAAVFGDPDGFDLELGALANVAGTAALLGKIPGGGLAAVGLLGLSGAILAHSAWRGDFDTWV